VASTACPGDRAYALLDAMRVPWTEPIIQGGPMPDNAELPNIEGPLSFHLLQNQDGIATGYYVFGTMTGEVHGHGPGARYFGRSEDPTPDDA
jgi:hypothetical protein